VVGVDHLEDGCYFWLAELAVEPRHHVLEVVEGETAHGVLVVGVEGGPQRYLIRGQHSVQPLEALLGPQRQLRRQLLCRLLFEVFGQFARLEVAVDLGLYLLQGDAAAGVLVDLVKEVPNLLQRYLGGNIIEESAKLLEIELGLRLEAEKREKLRHF
jgi:hypothetical protein